MESHLFTDVHLCERYEPLQQFPVFSDALGVPVRVCAGACVRVCVPEIKSFNVTDVRKTGYHGLLDGVLRDAFRRFLRSMQALTEPLNRYSCGSLRFF